MTHDYDDSPELGDLLTLRAGQLPDRVFKAVDAEVRRTRQDSAAPIELPGQRHANRWPWVAAAAAVLVLIGGMTAAQLLPALQTFVGGGPTQATRSTEPTTTATTTEGPSASQAGAASPAGMWATNDIDGSPMTFSISVSGPAWAVAYVDLRAVACGGGIYLAQGAAKYSDNVLTYTPSGGCDGAPVTQWTESSLVFDPVSDTLIQDLGDGTNLVWRRGPAPPDAFDGTWIAEAVPGRHLELDGTGLTRTVHVTEAGSAACGGAAYDAGGTGTIGSVPGEGRLITVTLVGGCAGTTSGSTVKFRYEYQTNRLLGPLSGGGETTPESIYWQR